MNKNSKATRRSIPLAHFMVASLAMGSLIRCNCDETEEFIPAGDYLPLDEFTGDDTLDFGAISVASEKTLPVEVRSIGSAGLKVIDALVDGASDKFSVNVAQDLVDGLRPGGTSTITVTYRPCPMAWNGNALKEAFDFNTCPGAPESADLSITDNSLEGSAKVKLAGQPVQPPVAKVLCPVGSGAMVCNMTDPNMTECNGMNFGTVNAGETPCDLIIEVENAWRNDKPVSDLEIESMSVIVKDLNNGMLYDGPEVGFEILDLEGGPMMVDSGNPFIVPIDPGGNDGSRRFLLRFAGKKTGLFRGEASTMTGLRLFTNDPDRPVITAPITAIGSAPDLTILIDNIVNFGPVEQGLTATATRTMHNFGDAMLRITDMRVETGNAEFQFSTSRGTNFPIELEPNGQIEVIIRYTPSDTGQDFDKIIITSNDIDPPTPDFIELRGGAVPTIQVDPSDVLVFALPQPTPPPPLPPREECLTLSNIGFGDLVIDEIEITGPDEDQNHPSVDDFTIKDIAACGASNPCDPGIALCPPTNPACMNSTTDLCIIYDNNDISTTDRVNLLIRSNDPVSPEVRVVLDATDVPCFFPSPIITVETPRPCVGQPVRLSASSSAPGGDASGMTTIASYNWRFLFAPPPSPLFMPQDQVDTLFIPEAGGVYIIALDIVNSCGAMSQPAGQETINVQDTGCD